MMDGGVLAIVASARVSVAAGKSASSTVSSASVGGLRTGWQVCLNAMNEQ